MDDVQGIPKIGFSDLSQSVAIGRGGFGVVHKALYGGKWVAYKEFLKPCNPEESIPVKALKRESRQFFCCHPNIVRFIGIVCETDHCGCVFEYIEYGGLDTFLQTFKDRVTLATKLSILHDVVRGMKFLHGRRPTPVIHGDLKAANVLIANDFSAKICDFGLSKWNNTTSKDLKSGCGYIGTITHIPPENLQTLDLTRKPQFDVYSFGILSWETMEEDYPFKEACREAVIYGVGHGARPTFRTAIPKPIERMIVKCWEQNPDARPSFQELDMLFDGLLSSTEGLESNNRNNATARVQGDNSFCALHVLHDTALTTITTVRYGDLYNLKPLAGGRFGVVYHAIHISMGPVAYKELIHDVHVDEIICAQLRREAAALNFRHPNIVSLIGTILEPVHYGLVFEYIKWKGLDDFINKFAVEWPMKLSIAHGVAAGMNYLHTRSPSVIHGDLRIRNVLVGVDYAPKICDYGFGKWKAFTTSREARRQEPVTHIPPEYWKNISLSRTTKFDVYGFGILVWELMTGEMSFQQAGDNPFLIMRAVIDGGRPDVRSLKGPADVVSVMRDCIQLWWHQDPNNRPSFSDIESSLQSLLIQHIDDHLKAKADLDAETAQQ